MKDTGNGDTRDAPSLIVLAIFFLVIVTSVVAAEERRLLRDFGNEYLRYKEKTGVIFPLPMRKTEKS